ncbi:MAG: metal ABC transporter ATP-binding protein [Alphaproteobacteria bacterium]|nr:metal ABC transporter ATP-binding protein [Alphaproteobacteria bacterium]
MISLKDVCFSASDGFQILDHLSFDIPDGKITTILGPNGAGKTTLLKLILGIIQPTSGDLVKSSGVRIGYVPQKLNLSGRIPLTVHRFLTLGTKYTEQEIDEGLRQTEASDLKNKSMQHLSGGELQRVILTKALLSKPTLLVLDEPSAGLDPAGEENLYALIYQLNKQTGCGILMVSHDLYVVMKKTDNVICLNHHVCCSGKPEEVADLTTYKSLYHHHHNHIHQLDGQICLNHS